MDTNFFRQKETTMSLYREFRPKKLSEITGQTSIITTIKNQIDTGNISHAYLFSGPRGIGKTSIAKILSRAVNCERYEAHQKGEYHGEIPCNECNTCRDILSDMCMDVIEMDAASNNGVEDIRAINDLTQFPPSTCRYKVLIIDEVHMLSKSAFNALLKTLEEPPEYIIFILATTEANRIPATILSRCQRYDFKKMSQDEILQRMEYVCRSLGREYEIPALTLIANRCEGAMRDALSILDQCLAYSDYLSVENVQQSLSLVGDDFLAKLFLSLDQAHLSEVLRLLKSANAQGFDPKQLVDYFSAFLQNIIQHKIEGIALVDISSELQSYLDKNTELNIPKLLDFQRRLLFSGNDIKSSANIWIAVECMFLDMAAFRYKHDIRSLEIRIAQLESKLSGLESKTRMTPWDEAWENPARKPPEIPKQKALEEEILDEISMQDIAEDEMEMEGESSKDKEKIESREIESQSIGETPDLKRLKAKLLETVSQKMQHLYMPIKSSTLSYTPSILWIGVASEYDFVIPMANTLQNTSMIVEILGQKEVKEVKFEPLKNIPTPPPVLADNSSSADKSPCGRSSHSQDLQALNSSEQMSRTRRVQDFFDKILK